MESTICPICNHRHSGTNHIWPVSAIKDPEKNTMEEFERMRTMINHLIDNAIISIKPYVKSLQRVENNRKYMKEYMRKWRIEQKKKRGCPF